MIIVHENLHGRAPAEEINNELSVETETNLAIEMLDTVLEAEYGPNSLESEMNSQRVSLRSINDGIVQTALLTPQLSHEKSPENVPTETINHDVIDDYDYVRGIQDVIDEILEQARAVVENKLSRLGSDDGSEENVFRNEKFLTHLSHLISKSNLQTPNEPSEALERKPKKLPDLKHSKSAPDLKLILESAETAEKSSTDGTNFENTSKEEDNLKVDDGLSIPPPPPIFSAELFEKVATLKRKKTIENEQGERTVNFIETKQEDDQNESSADESVDKENFRDKLEKLLQAPPTRLSLIAPVPLPRSSNVITTKDDNQASPREISSTPAPISATIQKQREMFDEVLKKIKRKEDDDNVPLEEKIK